MADDIRRSEGTEDLLAREYTNDEKYHVLTEESYKLICGLLYDLRHVGDIIEDDSIATNKTWSANKLSDLNSDNIKNDELVVHELSEVNTWLDITAADLAAHKTLIADNSISVNKTWSSNKISEEFEKYVPQNALSEDETVTEFLVKLNDIVGNLDDLTTDNKESLVDAIVELITKVGDITTLETPHKETVVDSINDLHSRLLPVGSVLPFGGAAAEVPEGFLLCDGAEYAIEDYPELFASIQHTYIKETNADATKFNVPDMRGKVPVGMLSSSEHFAILGQSGGKEAVALESQHLPAHTHSYKEVHTTAYQTGYPSTIPGHGLVPMIYNSTTNINTIKTYENIRVYNSSGSYKAIKPTWVGLESKLHYTEPQETIEHNNLQPYVVLNYIIKY